MISSERPAVLISPLIYFIIQLTQPIKSSSGIAVVPREIPMLPEKVPGKPPEKQSIRLLTAGSQFSGSSSFNHSAPLLNDEAAQEVSLEVEMMPSPQGRYRGNLFAYRGGILLPPIVLTGAFLSSCSGTGLLSTGPIYLPGALATLTVSTGFFFSPNIFGSLKPGLAAPSPPFGGASPSDK
jgi:hypothetical protein